MAVLQSIKVICRRCLKDKPDSDFAPGTRRCRPCKHEKQKETDRQNPEKARARWRRKYAKSRDRILTYRRIYYANHKYERPADYLKKNRQWRAEHRVEWNAKARVRYAVQSGKILRPAACAVCENHCKPQAHHFDYSRPLDVVWVCASCHRLVHSEIPHPAQTKARELFEKLPLAA